MFRSPPSGVETFGYANAHCLLNGSVSIIHVSKDEVKVPSTSNFATVSKEITKERKVCHYEGLLNPTSLKIVSHLDNDQEHIFRPECLFSTN